MKKLISFVLLMTILFSVASIPTTVSGVASTPFLTNSQNELLKSNIIGQTFIKPDGTTCKLKNLVDTEMSEPMFTRNYPYTFQGGCTDGEDYYFTVAFQTPVTDTATTADWRKNGYMIKYDVSEDKWYVSDALPIGHSNDICYNSDIKKIVSCNYAPVENAVDIINTDLTYDKRVLVKDEDGNALSFTQICYDDTNDRYMVTSRDAIDGSVQHYVLDADFKYLRRFKRLAKPQDSEGNNYSTQGTHCTNKYIFLVYSDNVDKTDNIVVVIDWLGEKVQNITIPVQQEMEDLFSINNVFYINFHLKSEGGYFYKSAFTYYTLKFDANGGTGTMDSAKRYYGFSEAITANAFEYHGRHFLGWTAYRESDDKWRYESADGSQKGWYTESEAPEGYVKYLYTDQQVNSSHSKTNGDIITLYAQWENNTCTVKYKANGGTGAMDNIKITYDVSDQYLTANAFTREGYTFGGWTGYRKSDSKWYCQSTTNADSRAWYTEDQIPEGYEKYVYTDQQKVSKLSSVDGDVVVMYAYWNNNKYSIKFNANGATGTMDSKTLTYDGAKVAVPKNEFKYDNYMLKGWRMKRSSDSKFYCVSKTDSADIQWLTKEEMGTDYEVLLLKEGDKLYNLSSLDGDTVKLGAVWKPYGDSDNDAEVTIKDVSVIQSVLAHLKNGSAYEDYEAISDVNGDGAVTIRDATYIQLFLAQCITIFPVSE